MSTQPPDYRPTTSTLAVVSLVSGLAAWVVLPFIGAIVAVVCGHLASGEIRRAPVGSIEGKGMATAGMVLGYVQLLLSVVGLVFVILVFFGIAGAFQNTHWN